jgi:hypothetical protein
MDRPEEKTEHPILDEIKTGRHRNKGCGWTTILIVPQPRVSFHGWSEPAATNAPVEDEPVQPVLRMNILPARRDCFFHLLSAPKFSTSPLLPPPSYLPPTNATPPHSIARAPETSSGCGAGAGAVAVERELELWPWSGSWSWSGWSWNGTHAPTKR